MMSLHDVTLGASGSVTPPFDNVIKGAQRNEQQGYDALWYYDHFMSWWPQSIWSSEITWLAKHQSSPNANFDVIATMSGVGLSTERIALGTSVTEPIRRSPAQLAQEFLTLDHITKGRVILGVGAGEACNVAPYGLEFPEQPVSRLEEAIKIIRLLWQNADAVDYDGRFWKLSGAVIGLSPYREGRYPPIWIGGVAPRTLRIVGELADGWLPPNMPIDLYPQRMAAIQKAATAAGRDPDSITYGLYNFVVIDESHEACHRMLKVPLIKNFCLALPWERYARLGAKHPLGEKSIGTAALIPTRLSRQRALELIDAVPFELVHEHVSHGTPEELAQHYVPYADAGCRHIAMNNITFVADEAKLSSSFRLMAELVKYMKGLA